MKQSYEQLIEHIQQLEGERAELIRQKGLLEHRLKEEQGQSARLQYRAKTTRTLNLGLVSVLDVPQIYTLACESLVYQVGWDSAFVLTEKEGSVTVEASFQATNKQLKNIQEHIGKSYPFLETYSRHTTFSTLQSAEKEALQMRSIFQTDEVVLTPLVCADRNYGVLAVCSHTQPRHSSAIPDLEFLSEISGLIANALHMSTALADLEEQNTKLRRQDELKNSFITITSHQLRTPLSIIKWILSMLESDPAVQKLDKQLDLLRQAYESNERMIHSINDLLNVSRIEDGHLPMEAQIMDVLQLTKDLVESTKATIEVRKLEIAFSNEGEIAPVEADPLLLREAIQCLLTNAVDYSKEGSTIRVKLGMNKDQVVLTVTNEGIGIAPSEQPRIFEQFYRAAEGIRLQPHGSGLGLYISKTIAEQHKGSLTFVSEPGKETSFTLSLPAKQVS